MQSAKMEAEDNNNLASRVASFSYYLKTSDQENFVQKIGAGLVEESISATIVSKETSFPSGRIKTAALINKPSSYAINFSNSIDSQDGSILSNQRMSLLDDHPTENFAFKLKPGVVLQDPKSSAAAAAAAAIVLARAAGPIPTQPGVERMINSIPGNGEIGIFGADKYFNMKLEYASRMKNVSCKNQELIDLSGMKSSSNYLGSATPSVYSEASSWDSGTALMKTSTLARNAANRSTSKPKMPLGRRIIASFGCTGQCMDSGAVYVAENGRVDSNGTQQVSKRAEPFAFPALCPDTQSSNLSARKKMEEEKIEELRKSLDVFGSETMKRGDIATNLERKLSMLTWDAIIPNSSSSHHLHPTTTTIVGSTTICDDMASDASSDLFEIENISGNMGYPILNMQGGGGGGGGEGDHDDVSGYCTSPTTQCYAPSEASIEWSVMTASAADFSSVISDYDEKYTGLGVRADVNSAAAAANDATGKKFMRSKKTGLLGCKSQKAVNVSETVHKSRVERY